MSYTVTAGVGGSRLGANWPVAAPSDIALGRQRDGQLRAAGSQQVTRAAFAFVALTAAAAASQLLDRGPLALPTMASVETALAGDTHTLELTGRTSTIVAPTRAPATAPVVSVTPNQALPSVAAAPAPASLSVPARPPAPARATTPAPAAAIHPSPATTVALTSALAVRGTPYVWGGATTRGFDCSGLVQWAYRKAGVALPRTSQQQSRVGVAVPRNQLRPGDLVFFYTPVHHVGIYLGNGQVLNAPQTGDVVRITPLSRMPFHNARRVV